MALLKACREDCAHHESLPLLDQKWGKKNGGEEGFFPENFFRKWFEKN